MTKTLDLYAVYSGENDEMPEGSDEAFEGCDPIVFQNEADARETFDHDIANFFVSKNRGFYIAKISGITEAESEDFLDDEKILGIFRNNWNGKEVTLIESWAVSLDDWLPESQVDEDDDIPEGAVLTSTGWDHVEAKANPYE